MRVVAESVLLTLVTIDCWNARIDLGQHLIFFISPRHIFMFQLVVAFLLLLLFLVIRLLLVEVLFGLVRLLAWLIV